MVKSIMSIIINTVETHNFKRYKNLYKNEHIKLRKKNIAFFKTAIDDKLFDRYFRLVTY